MLVQDDKLNELTRRIIEAAIEVHRHLGAGLLESVYAECFHVELAVRGLRFAVQRAVPITYKNAHLDARHYVDLIVEDTVVVEIKSVEHILPVHQSQTITYLHLTGCRCGLLINFNVPRLVDGVKRVINARVH